MRNAISITALAAFVLHALLGCCVHHAHAAGDGECAWHVQLPKISVALHECGHSHAEELHDDADSDTTPRDQSPRVPCDEVECVFTSVAKVEFAKNWLAEPIALAVPALLVADVQQQASVSTQVHAICLGPPLRPHLMFCVLVI